MRQRCVEAGAALFDITKVKARGESDRLDVVTGIVGVAQFVIISGNGSMLPASQTRDRIREGRTEVRVGGASVASPPAGIHTELFKIRKPSNLGDERDLARRQGSELAQVNFLLALGFQIGIEESRVTDLIIGVVSDILGHRHQE